VEARDGRGGGAKVGRRRAARAQLGTAQACLVTPPPQPPRPRDPLWPLWTPTCSTVPVSTEPWPLMAKQWSTANRKGPAHGRGSGGTKPTSAATRSSQPSGAEPGEAPAGGRRGWMEGLDGGVGWRRKEGGGRREEEGGGCLGVAAPHGAGAESGAATAVTSALKPPLSLLLGAGPAGQAHSAPCPPPPTGSCGARHHAHAHELGAGEGGGQALDGAPHRPRRLLWRLEQVHLEDRRRASARRGRRGSIQGDVGATGEARRTGYRASALPLPSPPPPPASPFPPPPSSPPCSAPPPCAAWPARPPPGTRPSASAGLAGGARPGESRGGSAACAEAPQLWANPLRTAAPSLAPTFGDVHHQDHHVDDLHAAW
jgi:hypothetical protein